MCSIIGFEKRSVPLELAMEGFNETVSRGPDMSRFVEAGEGWLGFHRLAIMGLTPAGMQPFELEGNMVVCNGELYGFRAVRRRMGKKYAFRSDSDCEIILPLYKELGLSLFERLDAEFAMVIFDQKLGLVAARDPIGIRPLYYGYLTDGSIVFASEPKNLVKLVKRIFPFPPGHYWVGGKFVRYSDITQVEGEYIRASAYQVCAGIRERLIAAVEKRLDSDAPVGFLLSGGLDSSLMCAIAAKILGRRIRTFAIGMDKDAIDLKYARMVADYIGADHTEVFMTRDQVIENLETVIHALGTWDITTVRASMGMYLVCKAIHETTDIRVLLTGEISDELFGYKYTDFAPSAEEFQKESQKRVRELHAYDVLRADRCISVNSLEARVPFGDLAFVKYVMAVDPEMKLNTYGMGKYLLRHAFEADDILPGPILWRQKAAFSDAVGHSMVDDLKAYAETVYTDEAFEEKRQKNAYRPPFTKESLLYREIFEKYYPAQADMIPDYWMPNPTWPHCAVSDPSARVLENYGASGV